jgi:hypothetical protein
MRVMYDEQLSELCGVLLKIFAFDLNLIIFFLHQLGFINYSE